MSDERMKEMADEFARWTDCPQCDDPDMHRHFMGKPFRWMWPTFDRTTPADTTPRVGWNRYPHTIIGAYVVLFDSGWGVRWKGKPLNRRGTDE